MKNNEVNRPLIGGITIKAGYNALSDGIICVTCFNNDAPAKRGFITCAHVVGTPTKVYQPKRVSSSFPTGDYYVGKCTKSIGATESAEVDAAFIECKEGINISAKVWKSENENYTVKGWSEVDLNTEVVMQGQEGQKHGKIILKNANVTMTDGQQTNQIIADYESVGGDSGAPVFEVSENNEVMIVGMNIGAAKKDDITPNASLAENTTYAIINPIESILNELDINKDSLES